MSKKSKQKDQDQPEETKNQISDQDDIEQQVNQLRDDLKRAQADFINLKRRSEQERTSRALTLKADIIRNILPVLDSLDKAVAHKPEEFADSDWVKGVEATTKQLRSVLNQYGVTKIESIGQEFDPNFHEAVSIDESADGSKEVVTEELHPGYKLGDTVIRHAMVVVGKK